jgi:hypothetical protein
MGLGSCAKSWGFSWGKSWGRDLEEEETPIVTTPAVLPWWWQYYQVVRHDARALGDEVTLYTELDAGDAYGSARVLGAPPPCVTSITPGTASGSAATRAHEFNVRTDLSPQRAPDQLVAEISSLILRNYLKRRRRR